MDFPSPNAIPCVEAWASGRRSPAAICQGKQEPETGMETVSSSGSGLPVWQTAGSELCLSPPAKLSLWPGDLVYAEDSKLSPPIPPGHLKNSQGEQCRSTRVGRVSEVADSLAGERKGSFPSLTLLCCSQWSMSAHSPNHLYNLNMLN